jgi:hypothetical protein
MAGQRGRWRVCVHRRYNSEVGSDRVDDVFVDQVDISTDVNFGAKLALIDEGPYPMAEEFRIYPCIFGADYSIT